MNDVLLVCPKCGRLEPDTSARFCDVDGSVLVSNQVGMRSNECSPVRVSPSIPRVSLILGTVGIISLSCAGFLLWSPDETQMPLGNVETVLEIDTDSRGANSSTDSLLRACYGNKPPLPAAPDTTGFGILKDVMRVGTGVVADLAREPLTDAEEREVGNEVAKQMERSFTVSKNAAKTTRVRKLVSRLARKSSRGSTMGYRMKVLSA